MTAIRSSIAVLAICSLSACATPAFTPKGIALTGAKYDADGMASIGMVPPTPWPKIAPPPPGQTESLVQKYARENGLTLAQAADQINGSPAFQAELSALTARLRKEQSANFLEVRIVRDPAVAAEIAFVRDPKATLAKYTSNPQFRAVQGGRSAAQLETVRSTWEARMRLVDAPSIIGTDTFAGRVTVEPGLSESEFRALAREQGWTWGDEVAFTFAPEPPAAQVDQSVRYPFEIFPRSKAGATIILTVAISGTIVLDHGCFRRLDRKGKPGNLVLFDRSAQIGTDEQGYLAIFDKGKVASRIGEPAIWGGYPAANPRDPDVRKLREVCGDGPIDAVGVPESARLFALPYPEWVADYAQARKIPYQAAWDQVIGCMKRYEDENGPSRFLEARDACIKQFN